MYNLLIFTSESLFMVFELEYFSDWAPAEKNGEVKVSKHS